MSFKDYTDSILHAFKLHTKPNEIIKRKQEILNGVAAFHNMTPQSVLYIGFNPAILLDTARDISVTYVSDAVKNFLTSNGIKYQYIDEGKLQNYYKKFDVVIALDEYLTFAQSDIDQKNLVTEICNLTKEYIITTCKDYKNQEFKDREFSIPAIVRNHDVVGIYLEYHDHDINDKNSWQSKIYEIKKDTLNTLGPFKRRALYFKQLAKFSSDAGAVGFTVHKNLMYKSLIKKNYEHVISIRFDNNGN